MTRRWIPGILVLCLGCTQTEIEDPRPQWTPESRPYLHAATRVGDWLSSAAVNTPGGRAWPRDAERPDSVSVDLATGMAGVALFFLELNRATWEESYLAEATAAADYLAASVPDSLSGEATGFTNPTSFYGGWAGVGFALDRVHRVSQDPRHREAALECARLIENAAREEPGGGVAWNTANDILNGSAGTGLFLLYAAGEMNRSSSRALAARAADALLARAVPDSNGALTWTMRTNNTVILPNFSHGAAGIGYFLASVYQATREERYLEAALGVGDYLRSVARTDGGTVFLVPYGWPSQRWEGVYDIGWAHGPAGTARFLYRLGRLTGDPEWTALVAESAAGIRASGLPGAPNPGFGDEEFKRDLRFGSAGVAQFFLRRYQDNGDDADLDYARELVDDIVRRATADASGMRWTYPQYAFFEKPGEPATYTGYFYGAAGFGLLLLQFDAAVAGTDWLLTFPDDPFDVYSEF